MASHDVDELPGDDGFDPDLGSAADEHARTESLAILVWLSQLSRDENSRGATQNGVPQQLSEQWVVGQYRLEALLGTGGYGAVFQALDILSNERVALKLAWPSILVDPEASRRFVEEPKTVSSLKHPGIVEVRDFGTVGLVCFIAFEQIQGPTLAQWLAQHGPMPADLAAQVVSDAATAVHFAHERDVIHRDLKPSNILLRPTSGNTFARWQPVVTDFGLARRPPGIELSLATGTGAVIGTDPYLSPEQAAGNGGDVKEGSDVFSLGVILYELITGRRPFEGESATITREMIRFEDPPVMRVGRHRLPRDLETIVLKCLEKSPERRYKSARDLAEDLERYLQRLPIRATRMGAFERVWKYAKRKPMVVALVSTVILSALVFSGLMGAWISDRMAAANRVAAAEMAVGAAKTIEREHRYASSIRRSAEALRHGNRDEMLALLKECRSLAQEPVRPGIAWDWLWAQANPADQTLAAHSTGVCAVRFSPKGGLLASGGKDGRVVLWESGNWKKTKELIYSARNEVIAIEFSADGSLLAIGGEEGRLVVFGMEDASVIFDERILEGRIFDLAWLGETTEIAVGGEGTSLVVVDVLKSTRRQKTLTIPPRDRARSPGHPEEISAVTYSRSRNAIGVFMTPASACFVDPRSLETMVPALAETPLVGCVCNIRLGTEYIAATAERLGGIGIWRINDGAKVAELTAMGRVKAVRHSPATGDLAVAISEGAIQLYDIQAILDGREQNNRLFCAHSGRAVTLDFSPDGAWLASGGWDGQIKLWRSSTLRESLGQELPWTPYRMQFSPCGRWLVLTVIYDRFVSRCTILDAHTGESLWSTGMLTWPDASVGPKPEGTAFAPSGDEIAVAETTRIQTYDARTGRERKIFRLPEDANLVRVSYSPDGELIVAQGAYAKPIIFDRTTGAIADHLIGQSERSLGNFRTIYGDLWLAVEPSHELALRVLPSEEPQVMLSGATGLVDVATVSPDGRHLAAGGHDGIVFYWDLRNSELLGKCVGHEGAIYDLSFSEDGGVIRSLSEDGSARMWHAATCSELLRFGTRAEPVCAMAINPDGTHLLLGTQRDGKYVLQVNRLGENRAALPQVFGPIPGKIEVKE